MSRATPPRVEGTPTGPRAPQDPSRFQAWLAVALCAVVLLASSAILERSRSFSRAMLELELGRPGERPSAASGARREPGPVDLVILLALDGLRADRLAGASSPTGSPRLASLRSEAVSFATVLAPASQALTAHKALLTGRYPGTLMLDQTEADLVELAALREPAAYLVDTFTSVQPLVAEGFRCGGFRTAAFTGGEWLSERTGFARGFEAFDDGCASLATALPRALEWLERARGRPAFLFVQSSELARCVPQDALLTQTDPGGRARYDARLLELDRLLGGFLDGLRARGLYEPALIALTAGYGLSLGERGQVGHGGLHLEELLVPLVLKFPQEFELAPAAPAQAVELVDLAPTLLEAAGLPVPGGMDGRSLLPIVRRGARGRDCLLAESVFRGSGPGQASPSARTFVRPGRWQVIHDPALGTASLFDLRTDPAGLAARAIASADVPDLLEALLSRARSTPRPRLRSKDAPRAELERALAELGYGGDEAAGSGPPRALR